MANNTTMPEDPVLQKVWLDGHTEGLATGLELGEQEGRSEGHRDGLGDGRQQLLAAISNGTYRLPHAVARLQLQLALQALKEESESESEQEEQEEQQHQPAQIDPPPPHQPQPQPQQQAPAPPPAQPQQVAFGPRAALALAQADQADPLAPAPQGPRRTIDASWTKAELLLLVYERRHGQFAGRNSPGDFSWKTWCQYRLHRWGFEREMAAIDQAWSRLRRKGWIDAHLETEAVNLCRHGLDPTGDAGRLVTQVKFTERANGRSVVWVL